MSRALVVERWRSTAFVAAGLGALLVLVLGAILHHAASTPFDDRAARTLYSHIDVTGAHVLIDLSTPALTFGILALVALAAAVARRWDLVAVAVIGPGLAVLLAEEVLKPIVGRLIGPYVIYGSTAGALPGAYPSGHETGVVSAAVVLVIAAGQLPLPRAGRIATGFVLTAWVVLAAIGLVRDSYHYATDTVGGFGVAVAVVLAVTLLVDRVSSPAARSPASTSPAA